MNKRLLRIDRIQWKRLKDEYDAKSTCLRSTNGLPADEEERLFFLFLGTHFGSDETAIQFINGVSNWSRLPNSEERLRNKLKSFFLKHRKIGDHRRFLRYYNAKKKAKVTAEAIFSYKEAVNGSQKKFFCQAVKPTFESLYHKMEIIRHFTCRLPRWDHIERLSRAGCNIGSPHRFYTEDPTYSGPLKGLTLLFFGKRVTSKRHIVELISRRVSLNSTSLNEKFVEGVKLLEEKVISEFSQRHNSRFFVYELESCLCNFQKQQRG